MAGPKTKRVVIIADKHCAHRAGLTPPNWQFRKPSTAHIWQKFTAVQEETWALYAAAIKFLQPVHLLIVNADCIDGRGERSGGVELITADRAEQCQMAVDCIKPWNAKHIVMTRGTDYHVAGAEEWEDSIAAAVGAKIGDHEWVDVNGFIFDVKHHVGSAQMHGRATPIKKEELQNLIWAEAGNQPRGDMIIRSHVHYAEGTWRWCGARKVEAMTTPALQAMGTRFGAKRCSGTVDWGLLAFDISSKGKIVWRHEVVRQLESTKAKALKV